MRRLLPLCLATGLIAAQGCDSGSGPGRKVLRAQWDTVWQTSRPFMDSTLPSPRLMTYSSGRVFVFDDAARRLVALTSRTGGVDWQVGRLGRGPAEFLGVASLFPDRNGGVAVVDIQNRQITRVTANGAIDGTVPIAAIGRQPNQVCAFGKNRFVVADVFQASLLDMDSTGALVRKRQPLWPDLTNPVGGPPQLLLRNAPTGQWCMVAIGSGRGFGLLSPDREAIIRPYVEDLEAYGLLARVDQGDAQTWAVADAEFVGDTLYTLFVGRTADRYRLLDRYHALSGSYLDTFRLPFAVDEFAAGDGTLFVVDSSGSRILALRPRL